LARRLAAPDGKLTLGHVMTSAPYFYRGVSAAFAAAERKEAEELLKKARADAGVEARLCRLRASSVGRGLHELVGELGADLLVVGSSSRGLLGRVLLGDDTRAALNGTPCAVAVAPAGYGASAGVINEVGVAYNGSPESESALEVGRVIAACHRARLSACEVVSAPLTAMAPGVLPLRDTLDGLVQDARDRIAALGGVTPHAVYGEPVEELARYSGSLDLLIVGSRGYGALGRLVHGSTSSRLARTVRCPLLYLPRAAAATRSDDVQTKRVGFVDHIAE
jgi:nucleotide-binding universal stress UspA family protein